MSLQPLADISMWNILWLCITLVCGYLLIRSFIFRYQRISSDRKAVLITGCDSGFGYLLCQRLAKLGYKVFAGCLIVEGKGAQELKDFSINIRIIPLDVTESRSVENAARIVSEELQENELWAIVNNAGIAHSSEMEWTSFDTIMDVFNVNTFGMVRVTQAFVPFLRKSRGRIVNVTSITAEVRIPGIVGYSMSKAAAKNFNDVIRLELKKWGIRVINVAPYFYGTQITHIDKVVSQTRKEWEKCKPDLRRELGDEYFETYAKITRELLKMVANHRVSDVVDCMEDGITSKFPKLCYRPGNITNKLILGLLPYYPTSLQDYIQSLYMASIKKQ